MSQNDMSIANASGSAVRADINSALQALASLSSGSSAPSTTYAYQLWGDTTNDLIKIRDEANTSWVVWGSLSGTTWTPYSGGSALGTMALLNYASITQNLVMNGKQLQLAKGADIAAASTVDLSSATGNYVNVTGNGGPITGWGTVGAGAVYIVRFTGAPSITHNATSNILPNNGSNISASAGCLACLVSLGSGNWAMAWFTKADGSALVGATAASSQAQMEGGTDTTTFVTPGRFHYHPAAAKAWAKFSVAAAIVVSYNVSSITDNAAGDWTVNFTTSFSSANYVAIGTPQVTAATDKMVTTQTQTASACQLATTNGSGGKNETNVSTISCVFFGDQ